MPADNRPPYFPLYVKDFYSSGTVTAMSAAAVGAYILLLCQAWSEEPPASIPNNDTVLARWAHMDSVEWAENKAMVLAAFTLGRDNRWHQKRLRVEYDKFRSQSAARAIAGKKGAKTRWNGADTKPSATSSKMAEPCDCHAIAIGKVITNDGYSSSSSKPLSVSIPPARGGPVDWHEPEYQERRAIALDILHEVNERCGKKFPDHYAEVGVIMDRLAEGRLREEFTRIVTNKLRDPVFTGNRNLYRPKTLFAADKFETYLYENPDDYGELKNGGSGKRASRRETGQYLAPGGPYPDDTPR